MYNSNEIDNSLYHCCSLFSGNCIKNITRLEEIRITKAGKKIDTSLLTYVCKLKGLGLFSPSLFSTLPVSAPQMQKSTIKSQVIYCQYLYIFYTSSLEYLCFIPPLPLPLKAALPLLSLYQKYILSGSPPFSFPNIESNTKISSTTPAKQKPSIKNI